MRKDRERSGGPTVEFVDEDPPPAAGDDEAVLARRVRDRAVVGTGLLVAVTGFPGSPTAAMVKAFATHLPGSIVISEHTSLTNRGRELDARKIRAVTGNVTLDIVVSRVTGLPSTHVTRIMQGVYAVTIRSKGIYPPTKQQLHRLAADRRLTAVL